MFYVHATFAPQKKPNFPVQLIEVNAAYDNSHQPLFISHAAPDGGGQPAGEGSGMTKNSIKKEKNQNRNMHGYAEQPTAKPATTRNPQRDDRNEPETLHHNHLTFKCMLTQIC